MRFDVKKWSLSKGFSEFWLFEVKTANDTCSKSALPCVKPRLLSHWACKWLFEVIFPETQQITGSWEIRVKKFKSNHKSLNIYLKPWSPSKFGHRELYSALPSRNILMAFFFGLQENLIISEMVYDRQTFSVQHKFKTMSPLQIYTAPPSVHNIMTEVLVSNKISFSWYLYMGEIHLGH